MKLNLLVNDPGNIPFHTSYWPKDKIPNKKKFIYLNRRCQDKSKELKQKPLKILKKKNQIIDIRNVNKDDTFQHFWPFLQ